MYTDFIRDDVLPLIIEAREGMNVTAFNGFVDRFCNLENKLSCDQYDDMVKQLHKGRDTQRKVTAAETGSNQIYVSALMGGIMKISYISRGKEHNNILKNELLTRDVDLDQPILHMEFKEAKRLLKESKYRQLEELEMYHMFENKENVTEFVPLSEVMQALMSEHNEWLTNKSSKQKSSG